MNSEFPSYTFKLEFFDERAELVRPYVLVFRTEKDEIEIYDVRQRRTFLKRTTTHNVQLKDLYIGNKLLINGRQYDVVGYNDEKTAATFNTTSQHTYAMIKPGFTQFLGETLERIRQNGLIVANLRMGTISRDTASRFYQEHQGKPFYNDLVNYITSGPVIGMELVGNDAIAKWRTIIGPTNLETAKKEAPNSLRALYARSTTENFAHGSDSPSSSSRELQIIFNNRGISVCSEGNNSTLCVIKPHALKDGLEGSIIKQIIGAGYQIGGVLITTIDLNTANEFLEVYKGVVPEYVDMAAEFADGPLMAIELVKENAVKDFRQLCGPRDALVAKQIRPQSLRAIYGKDIVHNAVHCTDLEEDAPIEVEYFFNLVDSY